MAKPKPVMVLCDSRGLGLQTKLNDAGPTEFLVRTEPSAGLVMAATKALSEAIKLKPDYIIIAAGICEVTLKNRITKLYTVKCTDVTEATKAYSEAMEETKSLFEDVLPNTKIIFNPVTGVDLTDYNSKSRKGLFGDELKVYHENKELHPMQDTLNATVISINKEIAKFNYNHKVATPWSASLVHKYEKKKYYHHYQYLSDGCHLMDECKEYWAEKFHKANSKSNEINMS